jgi:hypothetical protein
MATLYNKIFPEYQLCQLVKWRKNQRFKDHLCPRLQGTDVSGESVRVIYRPARVPRPWWCACQWELLVCVKSLMHLVIKMLSNQEAGLTQQALDTNQWIPLASVPSGTWNWGKPIHDTDWLSRCISTLKMSTDMVFETSFFLPLNQLTQLVFWEYFIIQLLYFTFVIDFNFLCI